MSIETDEALRGVREQWYHEAGINQLPAREPQVIHALTLYNPHAVLMALGEKRIETRSWPCPAWLIGKPLAIHAAKNSPSEYRDLCLRPVFREPLIRAGYLGFSELPAGKVVAVVRVVARFRTDDIRDWATVVPMPEQEWAFGDYADGRYGWLTELLHRFEEPIPAVGRQGLWKFTVPAGALEGVTL